MMAIVIPGKNTPCDLQAVTVEIPGWLDDFLNKTSVYPNTRVELITDC